MISSIKLLWILLITLSFRCPHIRAETISMHVGEQRDIELHEAAKVHISRRGIIHLVYVDQAVWRVTALKSGVVAVETKKPGSISETLYVDVTPRIQDKDLGHTIAKSAIPAPGACIGRQTTDSYALSVFVELIDVTDNSTSGGGPKTNIELRGLSYPKADPLTASIGMSAQPEKSHFERTLIADPEILTRPCESVDVSMGGEDIYQTAESKGELMTTWKEHGLRLHLEVIPKEKNNLYIPFSVIMRTPSRGRGTYGLSEVQSAITTKPDMRTLAATINLKSKTSSDRSSLFLKDIPIIGPLFTGFDTGSSTSKLLISLLVSVTDNLGGITRQETP
jgi:hypothetical protein